ncbi:ligand-binding sensor domain-containing protein [Saccharicrinis carchari]|uniref:Ligand-binding sensor domain-containing protein n=1 Tax=Saccharicrinis carchari TaxID=1168039 RepID=A0A521BV22_SACCC|nr:two-component regulator propeller domain-containing protein [Saccharicrinis carchari]SMO50998.1 ligand-binding sensor domain-containing protein [Saccharicrinis carchari]
MKYFINKNMPTASGIGLRIAMDIFKQIVFIVGFLFALPPLICSQSFNFKTFDSDMGLPQNYAYSLAEDLDGYMWIGTGEGLVRYDGIDFITYTQNDSLASDFVRSLFVDKDGVLWVGHNNGTLSYYKNGAFSTILPAEKASSPIEDITQDKLGNIWATVQNNGLLRIDPEKNITSFFQENLFADKLYYSVEAPNPFNILIGTAEGLMHLHLDEKGQAKSLSTVTSIPPTKINTIVKRRAIDNEYWIATEDQGFYKYRFNKGTTTHYASNNLCVKFNIEYESIHDIYEEQDGNLLLATWGKGVIKLFLDARTQSFVQSFNFSTENGLNHDYIKDIWGDREGNLWFATYGGGVSLLLDDSFVHYKLQDIGFKMSKAKSVMATSGNLWIGLNNGVLRTDPFCFSDHEYYDSPLGVPNDEIIAIHYDKDSTLWLASFSSGLFYREKDKLQFTKYKFIKGVKDPVLNDMAVLNQHIYLATTDGFYNVNLKTKEASLLTTREKLPHNNINFVYIDKQKNIWIGPKSSGICRVDSNEIEVHRLWQAPLDISGMTSDAEGNFWLATMGKGVMKYNQDSIIQIIDINDGLTKNYCYDIVCDKNQKLWVAHWPGISTINLKNNQIKKYDFNDQMGGDFYKLWEDQENNIWFASSNGIIKYIPDRDKINLTPPKINLNSIKISGEPYPLDQAIKLPYPYNKKYSKLRFDFTGISFKDPNAVTYQYKLETKGEDQSDWVDIGNTKFREYEFLPDGEYKLKIRAFNGDGIASITPITVPIEIASPVWKKYWFYLLLITFIGLLFYWIVKLRERQLRLQKEELEREVDLQTVILRKQKNEIERKNIDITASINYAKRIQSSILPPISALKDTFNESFIFFAPRDIVSGDFYWYTKHKDKFILCCADCTGHGVPGAFMSMIGTTLLNDINKRGDIASPADILEKLDSNINTLLQQDNENNAPDGMDISVIEINLKSKKVRLASAKRPVFLYINKTLTTYNGTRRSIGDDKVAEKTKFVNYEYDCSKGDSVYLFTDGYTDQFGGPKGKKMMKVGVTKLLQKIHEKPMDKQGELIGDYFNNWKGDLDQIDDVLFMGVRL